MIKALSFKDILQEERLREFNQCHTPSGPNGGQFCSTGGGGGGSDFGLQSGSPAQRRQRTNVTPLPGSSGPVDPNSIGPKTIGPAELRAASLRGLAAIIRKDWASKGKGINYAAKPYLEAMASMDKISDNYGYDSGHSIVAYFLGNARSWTGPTAKAVKAELNRRLKGG